MYNKEDRKNRIIQIIKRKGLPSTRNLSNMLGVSEMTIRRDLQEIKAQDISEEYLGNYNLLSALEKFNEQKNEIGKLAAGLIEPNDVIIMDTGSTVVRMLPFLPEDFNLTVICYNANIFLELRYKPGVNILFCGGMYHQNTEMCEGVEGLQLIKRSRANKVFLSAAGVHKNLGITCENTYEVPTKIAAMHSSLEKILVVDSSKFDKVKSSFFCELTEIHKIVSDKMISDGWKDHIRKKGLSLYI